MDTPIVILGAGPAGMAAAMTLSDAGKNAIVIEKDTQVGGLAKTLLFQEGDDLFRTDIGPHRFFSKNPFLYQFVENILHEQWVEVPRQTRQYIDGKFYAYPIIPLQALKNIGPLRACGMGFSYLKGAAEFGLFKKPIRTFEDYIIRHFGKKLGSFNMLNYTEKIWGIPCAAIHPDWAKQRIKGLNVRSALKNAFKKNNKKQPKSLVDSFFYPQYGTGLIYETIQKKIETRGSTVYTKSTPAQIRHKNGTITEVIIETDRGGSMTVSPAHLVNSIPIQQFISLLHPAAPEEIQHAANQLKWRSQVYLFITFNKPSIMRDNWIYFPDTHIPFGRISEMKNFSADMSPQDKTSLFIEFFVTKGNTLWNMENNALFSLTMDHLEKIGICSRTDVRAYYTFKKSHVYPVYDLTYKTHLETVTSYLDSLTNLYTIGRPGRFKYTNQDHSLEMGIAAAKSILENKKYDLEHAGSEDDYFESGTLAGMQAHTHQ
ncbi:MAG: hypothetical protein A3G08_03420 [Candidatus Magasanikbacteria bacterium RIFCSPLOWO2_12_FULL_47_9b]|nr:MAG: hypothetical protein A3I74_04065 [Candidatus Magasanikbacteria bacterium RIFCSPLOWO2_02_FULL_47_16]OGH79336.1 MAG: hypothetical protein A3C10_04605 [Candidatus Magasanikbacteria bacterium RIFCSPHIGHO2_02_FULL_48_18]OGH83445.1 MAG: hypothetical protein A3G08_03420 [Candidatus Magasanikbacteria bacterium RIFCSPLOWO2_12_FULL_47_9b]